MAYNPKQPRELAGTPKGGQWAEGGGVVRARATKTPGAGPKPHRRGAAGEAPGGLEMLRRRQRAGLFPTRVQFIGTPSGHQIKSYRLHIKAKAAKLGIDPSRIK